jgi:hypothetical protein
VIAVLAFIVLGGFLFRGHPLPAAGARGLAAARGLSLLPTMIVMALAAPVTWSPPASPAT